MSDNFFEKVCDLESMQKKAMDAFVRGNSGELFVEYAEHEVLKIEDSIIQTPSFDFKRGFGLRTFVDDVVRYSHSSVLNENEVVKALKIVGGSDAADVASPNPQEKFSENFQKKNNLLSLYDDKYFISDVQLHDKIKLLQDIDEYARSKYSSIRQLRASLTSAWRVISIITDSGEKKYDVRPMVSLSVAVVIEKDGVMESGVYSGGGRHGYDFIMKDCVKIKEQFVDEAIRQANVKMSAIPAPAGEMPVVLGNGWAGILLHEAVGHGLEGDAIRKKTSAFANLLGECVASPNVTVIDDGTIPQRRGSINCDDEGTPSQRNVLIENGKLCGFMMDRMNAKLMNMNVTGNGRRENYSSLPLPRMTNTFMLAGNSHFDEMVSSVKNGVFAKSFSGGQVDTASGKFVFSVSEAYLIEDGKITAPIKGATLIGDGPSILNRISMVGNDFSLDPGVGTCGKDGQWVPVGVGEPSVLIDKITVGGVTL